MKFLKEFSHSASSASSQLHEDCTMQCEEATPETSTNHIVKSNSRHMRAIQSLSALTASLKPCNMDQHLEWQSIDVDDGSDCDQSEESNSPKLNRYFDEFGFRIDDLGDLVPMPFVESLANRKIWLTCLEFSHTHTLGASNLDDCDTGNPISIKDSVVDEDEHTLWPRVHTRLTPSPRLTSLIRGQASDVLALAKPGEQLGIPHSLRPQIWPRLSGSLDRALNTKVPRNSSTTYSALVQLSSSDDLAAGRQIEKDLLRTMPNNICFSSSGSTGISRLRRVLRSLAWFYVDVGYCQGMGLIASNLLLCLEEESVFWMMCTIIEDLLPPSYFSSLSLLGVQADQAVLCHLLPLYLPEVDRLLKENEIDLPLVTLQWFLTLYSSVCPTAVTLRIWDLFFYEGSVVLFRIALALLTIKEKELLSTKGSSQLFHVLSSAPGSIVDVNELIQVAYSLTEEHLELSNLSSLRRHYLAQLMVDENPILNTDSRSHLPKQYLTKRSLSQGRPSLSTWLHSLMFSSDGWYQPRITGMAAPSFSCQTSINQNSISSLNTVSSHGKSRKSISGDMRMKNIRQTEVLVDLKQAILMIVRHFRMTDPQHANASSQADYSVDSHGLDLETYVQVSQHHSRRAKALLDFEQHEPDELGFQKNDIITVVNTDDEHCWIGELSDGKRGWFPAKFVELLDERGKNYSSAGDDSVDPNIASLVRGSLYNALGAIFSHGLKRSRLIGGESNSHPWHFIEEAAAKEVERDFASVYSRLVLCKTFRLDEEGKVLSPEEVLFRAIHSINMSHDLANAHMDVKFRSLICYGLNEQLLHMWLETLCSSVKVVEKWYYPWSYVRSPGWVQIKCELRVLSQFAFHLSLGYELDPVRLERASNGNACKNVKCGSNFGSRSSHDSNSSSMSNLKPLKHLTGASTLTDSINDLPSPRKSAPSLSNTFGFGRTMSEHAAYTRSPRGLLDSQFSPVATGDMLVKYHLFSWEL